MTKRDKGAGREYAEIWGEAVQANRKLRTILTFLSASMVLGVLTLLRIATTEPPKPIVVRVDEVGRAEALAYEAATAQADPLDPTTKYFLNRFVHDFHSRRRATVEEHWTRSLRFLSDRSRERRIPEGQPRGRGHGGRNRRDRAPRSRQVVLRIHPAPEAPHGAMADFDLVHLRGEQEIRRERWSLSLRFEFLDSIPPELVVHNPMGILITYMRADRALVTGDSP